MKKHLFFATLLSSVGALSLVSCGGDEVKQANNTFMCIKSFENVMEQEMIVYENVYPNVLLGCQYVTENEAFKELMDGKTRLIVAGRDLTPEEKTRLESRKETKNVRSMQIAVDAIALIVNPDNPVDTLTMGDVSRILRGEIKTWSQLQPGAPETPIKVVVDNPESGIVSYMRNKVIDGGSFDPSVVVTADSLSGVFNKVKSNKNYLGLTGSSWLTSDLASVNKEELLEALEQQKFDQREFNSRMSNSGVKTVALMHNSLEAYGPTQENIYSGDYPLTRPIYMITTASPVGNLGKFYSYVTGVNGQKIILKAGVMPARLHMQIYELTSPEF